MGGKIHLDTEAAKEIIKTHIAAPLELTIEEAALVVYRVAAAKMADTVRLVIAQQGLDPRQFSLVAAGGAFPLFAALVADELKIRFLTLLSFITWSNESVPPTLFS